MEWVRLHPYAATLAGSCILVIVGAIFVLSRTASPAPSGISAWSGNPGTLGTPSTGSNPTAGDSAQAITPPAAATGTYDTAILPYTRATPAANSSGTIGAPAASSSFDFDTLMAEIAAYSGKPRISASTTAAASDGSNDINPWSFVSTGLIATTSPRAGRTPAQQALYLYGNNVGSYIEGYDAAHSNQTQVLTDSYNDRQNPTKEKGVERIGHDLETIGTGIAETTGIPASAALANTALSNSYTEIGADLIAVAQSEALADSALVAAIQKYDAAVNTFNKNYIALSVLFSTNGVTFGPGDPGSVFSFTSNAL